MTIHKFQSNVCEKQLCVIQQQASLTSCLYNGPIIINLYILELLKRSMHSIGDIVDHVKGEYMK